MKDDRAQGDKMTSFPAKPLSPLMAQQSPHIRYEICATSEESKALLKTTQDVNEQICMVRRLRRRRSANLTQSEKAWIDDAIENTSNTLSGIAHFVEPVPECLIPGRRWMPGSSFLQQLRYFITDSPQLSAQLVRLSAAAQLLSAAMNTLSTCVPVTSEGRMRPTAAGTNTTDSSWNELSEYIHRRRVNSTPSLAGERQIPFGLGAQSRSPQSWNRSQSEEQSPKEYQSSETSPAASATSSGSPSHQTQASSHHSLEGSLAVSPPVQPWSQRRTTFSAGTTDHHDRHRGLTLIIETVEDWRQTTERALDNINALGLALTSGMMGRSTSTLRRTQPLRTPSGPLPRRKPVPARTLSASDCLPPPRPIIESSLQNSFDKEVLVQQNNHKSPIPDAGKTQEPMTNFGTSTSTPSLDRISNCSSENTPQTSPSTLSSASFTISRGRAWLERRAESFGEEMGEASCTPER